ncbi:NTP transferase domain-containing protein [Halorubrum gandharaense]
MSDGGRKRPPTDGGEPVPTPDAVLLCGGRGTRLADAGEDAEKPLVRVGGRPMVARVLDALSGSRVNRVHAVTAPDAPETAEYLRTRWKAGEWEDLAVELVSGTGEGYVADLGRGLEAACGDATAEKPQPAALTVVADLPLLRPRDIDDVLSAWQDRSEPSLTVCVPAATKRALGVSVDTAFTHHGESVAPSGLNVVGGKSESDADATVVWSRRSLAVNVNRPADLDAARRLAEPEV